MRPGSTGLALVLAIAAGAAVVAAPVSGRAASLVFDTSETELATTGFGTESAMTMAPGSTLTLETDANGDGVEGDVTVAASHFILQGDFARGGFGTFSVNAIAEITGGLGTAANFNGSIWPIEWTQPASFSIAGTLECFGAYCPFAPNVVMPFEALYTSTGSSALASVDLGTWNGFDSYFAFFPVICGEPPCPTPNDERLEVARYLPLPDGAWFQTLYLRGKPVAEPSPALLVVGALSATMLRRRASL